MLAPSHYRHNEIVALDRAYINYAKFEELTERGVVYVTKMKKNLSYEDPDMGHAHRKSVAFRPSM